MPESGIDVTVFVDIASVLMVRNLNPCAVRPVVEMVLNFVEECGGTVYSRPVSKFVHEEKMVFLLWNSPLV